MAQPKDQKLWQSVKREVRAASEGGESGRWSSRKAAIAQLEYKRRGGAWSENRS